VLAGEEGRRETDGEQEVGLSRQYARTVGISVDHRRQNHSEETFVMNVARLKEYQKRLIVFPRKTGAKQSPKTSEMPWQRDGAMLVKKS
jgi:hypothetical protein